jgi:hypothetical protein
MNPGKQSRNQITESWRDRIIEIAINTAKSLPMILSCHDSVLCVGTENLLNLAESLGILVSVFIRR